jgi:hypothetical protein
MSGDAIWPERRALKAASNMRDLIGELDRQVYWLSAWTIPITSVRAATGRRWAATIRLHRHPSLYVSVLGPEDRVAVKPHAGPVFHAILVSLRPPVPGPAAARPSAGARSETRTPRHASPGLATADTAGSPWSSW